MIRRVGRVARPVLLGTAGACATVYAQSAYTGVEPGAVRAARTLCYGGLVGIDYKLAARLSEGSQERATEMAAVHQRAAERLLYCCRLHGGLFNKLGQFVSTMNHVLPPQYTTVLAACQDRAEAVGIEAVRGVVETELGATLETLFESFDAEPIAAASLAQVHRAVAAGMGEVAVKVQNPHLRQQVDADLRTLRVLAWLVECAFPGYTYSWLLPEFERSMREELDFKHEAANTARVAADFAAMPQVYVPRVLPELSGGRVLTMEFVHGAKLSDGEALAALHLEPTEVATLLISTFAQMIFASGFVHCDPHPGNLLARQMPGGVARPQLVLLDHGMYRRLDPNFRRSYCELWHALLTHDHASGRIAARALGVHDADYETLSLLLTFRTPTARTALGTRMDPQERKRVRTRLRATTADEVSAFLERLPRDMLFVMRTWALVSSHNRTLGGTTRQRMRIFVRHATSGALEAAAPGGGGWAQELLWALRVRLLVMRARLLMSSLDLWLLVRYTWWQGLRPHSRKNLG